MSLASGARVFVTGAGGFVGNRLVGALRAQHPKVEIGLFGGALEAADIRDRVEVEREIFAFAPTHVVHLAAIAAVSSAQDSPDLAWAVNLGGTLNLLAVLSRQEPIPRMLHVSTSEVYGLSLNSGPANETALLKPTNVYAASKAAADLAVQVAAMNGLPAIIVRPFNHIGVGQSERFVVPALAGQIAAIEAKRQPPVIKVGSLDEERDFLAVEDVVAAYVAILEKFDDLQHSNIFNVASGRSQRIGDILSKLLSLSAVKILVEVDPARLRKSSVRSVAGDASKLKAATGWQPKKAFDGVLLDVLNAYRGASTSSCMS